MSELFQVVTLFSGAFGFALIFNVKKNKLFFSSLGGALAWCVYLLAGLYYEKAGIKYFFSALFLGLYSESMARLCRCPATVFLAVGFIPLIPGFSLYYTMHYAIRADSVRFAGFGIETVVIAASLAAGIISSISVFQIIITMHKQIRRKKDV